MRDEFERQLELLNNELARMGGLIESAIANAVKALDGDEHAVNKAYEYEKEINRAEKEIENLCLRLFLTQQPVATDLREISAALKMITDMERIGDQAEDIAEIAATAKSKPYMEQSKYIRRMAAATIDMVNKSVSAFINKDLLIVEEVIHSDDMVDALFDDVKNELLLSVKDNIYDNVLDMLMVAKYFERIGDHAVNIAEWVQYSITGEL